MDSDSAARQRFNNFKMGGSAPPQTLQSFAFHTHRRSRSRNSSISLSSSVPSVPPPPPPPPEYSPPPIPLPKRPSSLHHHHRRSSVSTRHESAELMGVSLPELPVAHSDDNINLGDRDSIRRRALWALEGKPGLAFSKVEIPDITSPDTAKPFEFPTKPSFPPGSGLSANNSFAGKRDSFGKMFGSTAASKDQLGTLLEEEEEEEEQQDISHPTEERRETSQLTMDPKFPRHRPASLNLRPLSLVQGSIVSPASGNLPTPTLTPDTYTNTRKPCVAPTFEDAMSTNVTPPPSNRHNSAFQASSRRFSRSFSDRTYGSCDLDKKRRSSISYKRSAESTPRDMFPLPAFEVTPTERGFPCPRDQDPSIQKPLSAADQHFLFRSHHVLLSRITELERTLRSRASQSRHFSFASDASALSSEPNNEMLQFISDLKAERDELKRDVDGWRQRVADADKQAGMLAKRIEAERRDAWVARSRLGLLEVEKTSMEKNLEAKTSALSQSIAENGRLMRERDDMKDEIRKLNARLEDADTAVDECTRLSAALEQERARRGELEKLLDDVGLLNTPKNSCVAGGTNKRPLFPPKLAGMRFRGLGFQSIDSEGSTTDVESVDDSFTKAETTLDVVAEEEAEFSDEENVLAGYEDEEDSDVSFSSPGGSSIGSVDELDIIPEAPAATEGPGSSVSLSLAQPPHESGASLSKSWTFPRGKTATPIKLDNEVDRFFGCLDEISGSPPRSEMDQSTFSSAFRAISDDELPPFVIPSDVGVVVESASSRSLDVLSEENGKDVVMGAEDDELLGEIVEGGIRFTFNAPPIIHVTPPLDPCTTPPPEIQITPPLEASMTTPAVRPRGGDSVSTKPAFVPEPAEDDEDESSLMLVFPPKAESRRVDCVSSSSRSPPPSRSWDGSVSPPSSIPRAISLRSISPRTPSITFTPSKNATGRFMTPPAYTTPPVKKMTSIPQPVTSPKSHSPPTKVPVSDVSSRQSPSGPKNANASVSAPRCPSSTQSTSTTSKVNGPDNSDRSPSSVCEYFHAQDTSLSPSIMSNPLAARLPFQKLSHFISLSWTPGAAAIASYIVPSSSGSLGTKAVDSGGSPPNVGSSTARPGQRGFVSKARQLEKLKNRLGLERTSGLVPCRMVSACRGCTAGEVFL